jgi:hypothetical protein
MNRLKGTLAVLLALLLTAGAGLVASLYLGRQPPSPAESSRLWDVAPASVVSLTVRGADGSLVHLEQDEVHTWHLVSPVSAPADQKRLDWLVDELAHLEPLERLEPDQVDLAQAGLLSPTAILTIGLRGGEERVMEIGKPGPGGLVYYVRVGDRMYLCAWDVVERVLRLLTIPPLPPETTPTPQLPGAVDPPENGETSPVET